MDLQEIRKEIDGIDAQLISLLKQRMEKAAAVAVYKKENGMKIYDPHRERDLLLRVSELAGEEHEADARVMFSLLMDLSRSYQGKLMLPKSKYENIIASALESTDKLFPEKASIACQGTEGAYSQAAAEKLFSLPNIVYCNSFDGVFNAIDKGLCRYGVLPIENSTAGSVNHIYDLMTEHSFYIVRSTRIQVNHCLLTKQGVKLEDIREIVSHEQAINQCSEFLSTLKNVKITTYANTALAAQAVANSDRCDIAALSSASCAELYSLSILKKAVQNKGSNYTRFICISKKPEIYPGADRTSLMLVLPHKPGSLYRIISRFYAHNINITKLESRPIAGSDFEFMFYFDVNASVYSPALSQLICELENELESLVYLGSYSEIV